MPVVTSYARPSTLADVIAQVRDAFSATGDATPVMVGEAYLERGMGSPPRVVFVPEDGGSLGPPIDMGNAASISHGCSVHVRAAESGDDVDRYRAAYALADIVIDMLATAAPGRIKWSKYDGGDTPTSTDGHGAGVSFAFAYQRDVVHSARRWSLIASTDTTTAQGPIIPPGGAANGVTVVPTTTPES